LSPTAARHLLRTDGFAHVADIMVGSFYDPMLDEGCAFEELISFHGGLGGPQTRAFILAPARLPLPAEPIMGAAAVHGVLSGWRAMLQGAPAERARLADATPGGGQQLGSELAERGGGDEVTGEQPAATP
jgi:hypothetical protein